MYTLQSDGGARGNPGPAGAGYVIYDDNRNEVSTGYRYLGEETNNVAEYCALLIGLDDAIERGLSPLTCQLDSELIVKQIKGEYKVKNEALKILFAEAKKRLAQISEVKVEHIRREKNKRADQLANQAMDEGE